jgi:L-ascorbate metabolism protein UlaG (beta-lactamase superfamily)
MSRTTFTWLGQAGLLFEIGGLTVLVDKDGKPIVTPVEE